MIRFGVIGTSSIVNEFVTVCSKLKEVEVVSVYSRNQETGEAFAKQHGGLKVYTNYEKMLVEASIDAIYVGSPNAFHFEHTLSALVHNKHVLCEKPFTSNSRELRRIIQVAQEKQLVVMEAVKALAMPAYEVLKSNLEKVGTIRKVFLNFCQYSSKYDGYKAGNLPNIFNPIFSTGSLMDIGVYCVYPCIDLFGVPKTITSQCIKLESGVDGSGTILLGYDGFEVILSHAKTHNSTLPSMIHGEKGSLAIDFLSRPSCITWTANGKEAVCLNKPLEMAPMTFEIQEFARTIEEGKTESAIYTYKLAQDVMALLDEVRAACQIVFPADSY